ncbi:hypothetical protein [Winogradskyella sp. 3972H.M.0a.05]|uniref:hypothetical protein n=1 Tax=Winogradskyella sp. 3972H.M.0a.05 TaxID=2950277 RepID=UPI00339AD3C8
MSKTWTKIFLLIIFAAFVATFIYIYPISKILDRYSVPDKEIYETLLYVFLINILVIYIIYITVLKSRDQSELNVKVDEIIKLKKNEISTFLEKLFNSDDYYTYISTTLPKGKNDEEHGIDYIPFMLDNLRLQKKSFKSTSNIFLVSTIMLAMVFSGILIYYGNILIKDDSVGLNKSMEFIHAEVPGLASKLDDLKEKETLASNSNAITLINTINSDVLFLESALDSLIKKNDIDLELKIPATVYDIPNNFKDLDTLINRSKKGVKKLTGKEQDVEELKKSIDLKIKNIESNKKKLIKERTDVVQLISDYEVLITQLRLDSDDLKDKFDTLIGKSPLTDFFKRLSIGLIIATFFLAILKFSANLYRDNYNQMAHTQSLELEIRRLYIAFKNINNDESRKIVLNSLLDFKKNLPITGKAKTDAKLIDINSLISQLITALEKKV